MDDALDFAEFSPISIEEWLDRVAEETGHHSPEDFLRRESLEGITIPSYLTRTSLDDVSHLHAESGRPPLADTSTVPANRWTICQRIDHSDPKTAGDLAGEALEGGAEALSLGPPIGAPSPSTASVRSVSDLLTILEAVDLSEADLHLRGGVRAAVLYAALREVLSEREVDATHCGGSIGYDPVAAFAAGHMASAQPAFDLATNLYDDAQDLPHFASVTIDSSVYHGSGASLVQELALTLGALAERLDRATESGTSLSGLLDDLHVQMPVATSYFPEIAKLRALRLLVPQVVRPYLDAAGLDSSFSPDDLTVHAETSPRSETAYDPHANMLRGTTEALAAVIGGCDVLTVRRYDSLLGSPDSFGPRIARNVQLILRHEARADQVRDPAAGSYFIEALTDQIAQTAWSQFQDIEAGGGLLNALREGTVQDEIGETRKERLDAVDTRDHVLVGTSHYPNLDEKRLNDRATSGTDESVEADSPPPSIDSPTVSSLRQALREGITLGNLVESLRSGEPQIERLRAFRVAAEIEDVRLRTEEYAKEAGTTPRVLLVPMGSPSLRSARATFSRNFLGVAGFDIEEPLKFDTVAEAADAAVETNADVVVLCSSDDEYPEFVPNLRTALDARGREALLIVAGSPEAIELDDDADLFIHKNSPLADTLKSLQSRLGMR